MRPLLILATILCLGLVDALVATGDDSDDVKRAIPADSAMMHTDFERLITSSVPKASDVEDKSLTLMLFAAMKVEESQTPKQQEQFRYLFNNGGVPKPSDLAREMCRERRTGTRRIVLAPVTFIHEDRITDYVCEVEEDTATGNVAFEAPRLYRGKVDFVARRIKGKWFIAEFIMPAYSIHVIRGKDGTWKNKSADSESD